MLHCLIGLQCNQTPVGGCNWTPLVSWMVFCPWSGRWQCALHPQIRDWKILRSSSVLSSKENKPEAVAPQIHLLSLSSYGAHNFSPECTIWGNLLSFRIPDISCLSYGAECTVWTYTQTLSHKGMLVSKYAGTQYFLQSRHT